MPQCNSQAHSVEAALTKVADITVELPKIHLLRLPVFFFEVAGILMNFGETSALELAVFAVIASGISYPAIFKAPRFSFARSTLPGTQRSAATGQR